MGCLVEVFALPFKAVYWFFKVIWEIAEHLSGHRHHRRGRRRPSRFRHNTVRQLKRNPTNKRKNQLPNQYAQAIESKIKFARDKRRKVDTRLDAYREALSIVDKIREDVSTDTQAAVNTLERTILHEYRSLMDANTTTTGTVTVGPNLSVKTAKDAHREGIQGAMWSALDDSCSLCRFLDGMTISVDNPDFDRFVPPLHDGCTCTRVYILNEEEGVEFDWKTPPESLLSAHEDLHSGTTETSTQKE